VLRNVVVWEAKILKLLNAREKIPYTYGELQCSLLGSSQTDPSDQREFRMAINDLARAAKVRRFFCQGKEYFGSKPKTNDGKGDTPEQNGT